MNLQKGLVGHWTMDDADTSGGTLYDRSAYDNHGTINGPTETTGLWGTALDFTQSNSDHIITNEPTLSGDPVATLSVWAKASTTNQTDWTGILSLGTNQSTNTTFTINVEGSGNNIAVHTWGNSTADIPLDDTNWHHYVGINTGEGTQKFYYDGEFIGSMDNTLSIPSEPSVIGARKYAVEDNNSRFWEGKIQDARIYNRVLSEDEINALYQMREQRTAQI